VWFGGRDGNLGSWRDGKLTWLGTRDWEASARWPRPPTAVLGTEHGLFRMRGDKLADAVAVVPGVAVRSIVPDAAGSVWLATEDSGLMHWRAGAVVPVPRAGRRARRRSRRSCSTR